MVLHATPPLPVNLFSSRANLLGCSKKQKNLGQKISAARDGPAGCKPYHQGRAKNRKAFDDYFASVPQFATDQSFIFCPRFFCFSSSSCLVAARLLQVLCVSMFCRGISSLFRIFRGSAPL